MNYVTIFTDDKYVRNSWVNVYAKPLGDFRGHYGWPRNSREEAHATRAVLQPVLYRIKVTLK